MWADEGGLRLCISNKPPGHGVHRQNKCRAAGRQGSPELSGGKPVRAMAEALKQRPGEPWDPRIVCILPKSPAPAVFTL